MQVHSAVHVRLTLNTIDCKENLFSDGNEKKQFDQIKESGPVKVLDPEVEEMLTKLKLMHLRPIFAEQKLTMEDLNEMEEEDLAKELVTIGVRKPIDQFGIVHWVNGEKMTKMLRDKYLNDGDNENWNLENAGKFILNAFIWSTKKSCFRW